MLSKLGRINSGWRNREQEDAPPGQFVTTKFPVLTYGPTPRIDLDKWQFRVFGLVDEEVALSWAEFTDLPKITLDAEFHCVTQWSKLQNTWEGVAFPRCDGASQPCAHRHACYGALLRRLLHQPRAGCHQR